VLAWAENFDRELVDLFDLQDDIAGSVLVELSSRFKTKLDVPQLQFGTDNIEAYNAYLQGRHESVKFTGKACDLAVDHLRRAIKLDPNFLRARLALITSLQSLRVILGRDGLVEIIDKERAELRALDAEGKIVNWEAADKMASDDFGSILDTIEKMLTGALRYPEDVSNTGASADRWWAAGFSVDDGVSGKLDALAQYGLLLAEAGLYETAKKYMRAAEHESTAYVNVQIISGELRAARETIERYIESNPHIIIHYFTYMIILDRLGEHKLADQQYDRIISTVDAGLQQVAHVLRAYWNDDVERLNTFISGVDDAVTPYLFRGLCRVANDLDMAMQHFRASFEAREPFVVAMRVWIPSNVKSEDWDRLLDRADMQQLLVDAGVGADWQNELRNRAIALTQVTDIEVVDGEF
jgi:tetratricopeptide (TPR) repeat protein